MFIMPVTAQQKRLVSLLKAIKSKKKKKSVRKKKGSGYSGAGQLSYLPQLLDIYRTRAMAGRGGGDDDLIAEDEKGRQVLRIRKPKKIMGDSDIKDLMRMAKGVAKKREDLFKKQKDEVIQKNILQALVKSLKVAKIEEDDEDALFYKDDAARDDATTGLAALLKTYTG
jgi:hypothetical protein